MTAPISYDDGVDLRAQLRRSQRRQQLLAFGLVAPLLLFLAINFITPIALILKNSVDDRAFSKAAPEVVAALKNWDHESPVPQEAVSALISDLVHAKGTPRLNAIASRLNQDVSGYRSLIMSTARRLTEPQPAATLDDLARISPMWEEAAPWKAIQRASGPVSSMHLLAALDLQHDVDGNIAKVPPEEAVFLTIFGRTFWISMIVTACCLLLGYPVAYLLCTATPRAASIMMLAVLIPFWTALLVRTSAWVVLLQREGVVNHFLQWIGVTEAPLELVFNRTGTYIALVHVLLPFMILPIYSLMKGVSVHTVRAAISLGSSPFTAFRRVYFPQTIPGVISGCLLVFVLSIGFYITPALIGGISDQMIGYFIAHFTTETANWPMGAALGGILLLITIMLLAGLGYLRGRSRTSR